MKPTILKLCMVSVLTLACLPCFSIGQTPVLIAHPVGPDPNSYQLVVNGLPAHPHTPAGYDFLWLFGDGQFALTTHNSTTHTFVRSSEEPLYEATVTVYISGRYTDSNLPPLTLTKVVTPNGGADNPMNAPQTGIGLQTNHPLIQSLDEAGHSIVPGDVNVCMLTYANANTAEHAISGRLFFFYNEHGKPINETMMDQHTVFENEKLVPAANNTFGYQGNHNELLNSAFESYTGSCYAQINNLAPGEKRSLALVFKIADDIPPSWGDVFCYHAIFIPDGAPGELDSNCVQTFNMAHVNVHDPNYLHVSKREVRWKAEQQAEELVYTLYYQNEGNDDARQVLVEMPLPPSLDAATLRTIKEFPEGGWKYNGNGDTLSWLVETPDSGSSINSGYIKFALKTGGAREKQIVGQAKIRIWGVNALNAGDSLHTNKAVTSILDHWRWGARLGIIANQYSGMDGFGAADRRPFSLQYVSAGLSLAPHDPYAFYRYHELSLSCPVFRTNQPTRDYSSVLRLDFFPYKMGYHHKKSGLLLGGGAALSLNIYSWDQDSGQERFSILKGQAPGYQSWGLCLGGEASFPFIVKDLRLELRYQLIYNTLVAGRADHWYYTFEPGLHYTFGAP